MCVQERPFPRRAADMPSFPSAADTREGVLAHKAAANAAAAAAAAALLGSEQHGTGAGGYSTAAGGRPHGAAQAASEHEQLPVQLFQRFAEEEGPNHDAATRQPPAKRPRVSGGY
jgi:hypothetical protein